ncbi:lysophospholipid acyltransferase family protein [Armatimonas sp.]|uniref:lysophospholipid acyltransferase family protein n=1 Tax=Armatimonas sp. TaxID=1872638 RepID=UPI0037524AA5
MPEKPRPLTLKVRALSGMIAGLVKLLAGTARLTIIGEETAMAAIEEHNGGILVTWHGRTLIPLYRYRNRGYWALVSLSKDGDIQARNFARFGFQIVRGSTGRGGDRAAVQMLRELKKGGVLAFTPDGPRGPARKVQPGVVFFARRSGKPILPLIATATPCKRLTTWDNYLLPAPFSRAAWVFGDPIFIPPDESDEDACRRVEEVLNACEAKAEAMLTP